jgi:hypothetical protein
MACEKVNLPTDIASNSARIEGDQTTSSYKHELSPREKCRSKKYYWEIIADNLSKAGWSWGVSQPWIVMGEQSRLLLHIATMASGRCTRR